MSQTSQSKIVPENWFPACWIELGPGSNEMDYLWTKKENGKLYSLQIMESPEAKMEAANLETIGTLEQRLSDSLLDNEALEIKIDRLTADLAAMKEQRDRLLDAAKDALNLLSGYARSYEKDCDVSHP